MQNATTLKSPPFTARLPDPLRSEAQAYADGLGLSLNALLAVALREYLDMRGLGRLDRARVVLAAAGHLAPPAPASSAEPPDRVPSDGGKPAFKRPASRSDPCPCGAVDARGYRLKWRQCHGKAE